MKVIGRSAGGDQFETLAAGNAYQVGMKFVCAGCRDERAAVFRAENTMNNIARVCVRHFAPSLRPPAVGLAILRRPYGTPIVQRRSRFPTLKRGVGPRDQDRFESHRDDAWLFLRPQHPPEDRVDVA